MRRLFAALFGALTAVLLGLASFSVENDVHAQEPPQLPVPRLMPPTLIESGDALLRWTPVQGFSQSTGVADVSYELEQYTPDSGELFVALPVGDSLPDGGEYGVVYISNNFQPGTMTAIVGSAAPDRHIGAGFAWRIRATAPGWAPSSWSDPAYLPRTTSRVLGNITSHSCSADNDGTDVDFSCSIAGSVNVGSSTFQVLFYETETTATEDRFPSLCATGTINLGFFDSPFSRTLTASCGLASLGGDCANGTCTLHYTMWDFNTTEDAWLANGTGTVAVPNPPLSTPSISSATPWGENQLVLAWGAVTGATSYSLEYKVGSGSFQALTTTADTSVRTGPYVSGTEYTFRVRATASGYPDSEWSSDYPHTYMPAPAQSAPTWTSIATDGGSGIDLDWTDVTNNYVYDLQYKLSANNVWLALSQAGVSGSSASYSSGFTEGNEYDFRVRSRREDGVASGWTEMSYTVPTTEPEAQPAPTWTSIATDGGSGIDLDWTDVTNNYVYDLQYKLSVNNAWLTLSQAGVSGSSASYSSGFIEGNEYDFRVRSRREDGVASDWAQMSYTVPTEPDELTVSVGVIDVSTSLDSPYIGITYNAYPDATTYRVDIQESGESTWTQVVAGGTYQFCSLAGYSKCVYGFEYSTSYSVRVRALNSSQAQLAVSNSASFTTPSDDSTVATPTPTPTASSSSTPATPATPTVTGTGASTIRVSWSAPNDGGSAITGYSVRHRVSGTSGWSTATGLSCCSRTIGSLSRSTRYEVQVQAVNVNGGSSWSESGFGTTSNYTPQATSTPRPVVSTATPTPTVTPVPWSGLAPTWGDTTDTGPYRAFRVHDAPTGAVRYEYRVGLQDGWSSSLSPLTSLEGSPDLDMREPFLYACEDETLCVGGLKASEFYFAQVRAFNSAGEATEWSDRWGFGTDYAAVPYEYPDRGFPTPTATSTVVPTPTVGTSTDGSNYDISAPSVLYSSAGSQYVEGAQPLNVLNMQFGITAPTTAVTDPHDRFNHYSIGVASSRDGAQRRVGYETNCQALIDCVVSYTSETTPEGTVISDAYVLYFWVSAHWLVGNGAPLPRTDSRVVQFLNPLMQGQDVRPGLELVFPGSPDSRYEDTNTIVTVLLSGLQNPESLRVHHYQTQVNEGRIHAVEALSGNASHKVFLREDDLTRGYATLRTRARVGPGDGDGQDYIEVLGVRYYIPPYGYIYSQWDAGHRVSGGRTVVEPVPVAVDIEAPSPDGDIRQGVVSIVDLFFPETTKTEEGVQRWMVLACLLCTVGGGGTVLVADSWKARRVRASALFASILIGTLIWVGLGLSLFGLRLGQVAIPIVIPALLCLYLWRKRL